MRGRRVCQKRNKSRYANIFFFLSFSPLIFFITEISWFRGNILVDAAFEVTQKFPGIFRASRPHIFRGKSNSREKESERERGREAGGKEEEKDRHGGRDRKWEQKSRSSRFCPDTNSAPRENALSRARGRGLCISANRFRDTKANGADWRVNNPVMLDRRHKFRRGA